MSRPYPSETPLPFPKKLKLNLENYLANYYLFRSFQRNFSCGTVTHLPVPRYAFEDTIVGGDHYFEYRLKGKARLVITVTFFCSFAIDLPTPTLASSTSSIIAGARSFFIFYYTVPSELPHQTRLGIQERCSEIEANADPILEVLEDFIADFYRPLTPVHQYLPLGPLENQ